MNYVVQIHKAKVMALITEVKQIGTDGRYMIRYTNIFAHVQRFRIYDTGIKRSPTQCLQNVTAYLQKAG